MITDARERARNERGAIASQAAILFPVVFALFLACVHYTYMYQAGQALDDGGQEAVRVLMRPTGTPAKAQTAAGFILNDSVVASWSMTIVDADTVELTGTSETILPGLPTNLTRTINFTSVEFLNEEDR